MNGIQEKGIDYSSVRDVVPLSIYKASMFRGRYFPKRNTPLIYPVKWIIWYKGKISRSVIIHIVLGRRFHLAAFSIVLFACLLRITSL